jgi:hypothetical protein
MSFTEKKMFLPSFTFAKVEMSFTEKKMFLPSFTFAKVEMSFTEKKMFLPSFTFAKVAMSLHCRKKKFLSGEKCFYPVKNVFTQFYSRPGTAAAKMKPLPTQVRLPAG